MIHLKKTLISSMVVMAMSSTTAHAAGYMSTNNNFTMLTGTGGLVGGTNDVNFTWDGTLNTDPNTAVVNATISSDGPTPFFGQVWTAYNVKIYGPGSYILSTADTTGGPGCPYGLATCASGGDYSVTVPAGAIMADMKFAWGTTEGIDVVDVWKPGSWSTLNPTSPIFTGAGGTYTGPNYGLVSTDWNGSGHAGAAMIDGPFQGFHANFNVNIVPLPAAFWLFGSGLMGLFGFARTLNRKR